MFAFFRRDKDAVGKARADSTQMSCQDGGQGGQNRKQNPCKNRMLELQMQIALSSVDLYFERTAFSE
jgi:hypothetical protein